MQLIELHAFSLIGFVAYRFFYALFYLLFVTKQKVPQKLEIKLLGHFMMSTIHSFLRWLALSMIQVPRIIPDCL